MSNLIRVIAITAVLGCIALNFAFLDYVWENQSGHSGADPYDLAFLTGPLVPIGAFGLWRARHPLMRILAALTAVSGIFGVVSSIVVARTGLLLQYEAWIDAGMPEPPGNRATVIGALAIAYAVSLVVAGAVTGWFLWTRSKTQPQ